MRIYDQKKRATAGLLTILFLVLASCAPAAAPTPRPVAPTAELPKALASPEAKPAAPAATPKLATEEPRYGGILNIAHFANPMSYDPIQESSLDSIALIIPSYSGVVQHDPLDPTKVIGDLAERWDMAPDGLSYTFYLNRNVRFHDGTPLTSEDAHLTLEVVREPPKGVTSPRKEWLKAVHKIETPDKDTLRITLQYPSASFLHSLADGRMVAVPKHVWEAKGNMRRDILGTGPYKFKSFTSGASFEVVKNGDYFIKGRPYLDGITRYIIPDPAARFAALRTRRVAMTPIGSQGLTPSQSETVRKDYGDRIVVDKYPGVSFHAFWMPHTRAPWSDLRVRRAVELTIDRPNSIKVASEGVSLVGGYMLPGTWSLSDDELMKMPGFRQPKDGDIAEAKRLMVEAGYPQGFKTTTIARSTWQHERGATAVKDQLAQIGIEVTIKLHDQGTMFDLLYKRNYDSAVFSGTASYDDPDQVFGQQFISGVPRNFSDFSDERIDRWYDEQSRAMDPAKRKQIVLDMQRRLHELLPASMLQWSVFELGRWTEVRDFKAGIGAYNNLKFQNVWLAK